MPRVRQFLSTLEDQFCKNIDASDERTPFRRCPHEVGWSQEIQKRLKEHENNSSTTSLFAYCNALTRVHKACGGPGFDSPLQLILFPIWENEKHLKSIAEILGSVLCSSYWFYGGLNITYAGASNNSGKAPEDSIFVASGREALRQLDENQCAELENEDVLTRLEASQKLAPIQDLRVTVEGLEREQRDAQAELSKSRTRREKLRLELKSVKKRTKHVQAQQFNGMSDDLLQNLWVVDDFAEQEKLVDEVVGVLQRYVDRPDDVADALGEYDQEVVDLALDKFERVYT